MVRPRWRQSTSLVILASCLMLLANLGLGIHDGHHSFDAAHGGATVHPVVGHSAPDPTLHLESVSEMRTRACPGCLLQHQVSGSYLQNVRNLDWSVVVASKIHVSLDRPIPRFLTTAPTRGPPLLIRSRS